MLEILFLLLPIAAAYGWYMGNRSAQQDKQNYSHKISRQYVTGLNLLLSDQSDQAVDHFIELLQVDDDTIDTHLALGNLFRSRGEVDRAIRIHQNLISRPNLVIDQKNLALQQLAKDYMLAGFLDRAEKILEQLLEEPDHKESALQQLMMIYQQTKEWEKAIACGQALAKLGQDGVKSMIAHFWCELALIELAEGAGYKARQWFEKALAADAQCVRASLGLGRLYFDQKEPQKAIAYLEQILQQDVDFVSEALPILTQCYQAIGQDQGLIRFLRRCQQQKAGVSVDLLLAQLLVKPENYSAALELLTRQLVKNPTMKGFYRLMDYHILEAEEGRAKESLTTLKNMVGEQLKVKPHYRCRHCGFATHSLYWHCPSCKTWGNLKPIRGLDGE